jgi:putative ABC transport system permease protein
MNYIKVAWRTLKRFKMFSFIYLMGLSIGLAVVLLDGLWIRDELAFNKVYKNYSQIAQVMHRDFVNGERMVYPWNPAHLGDLLRKDFQNDFTYIVMSTYPSAHILTYQGNKISEEGNYMSRDVSKMIGLHFIKGQAEGSENFNSIFLSEKSANAIFGGKDPMNAILRLDNQVDVKVTGVYQDLPDNSEFKNLSFITPWELLEAMNPGLKSGNPWYNCNYLTYVQIGQKGDFDKISEKIKNIKQQSRPANETDPSKIEMFLHPMAKWHLYAEFKDGKNVGGRIGSVWLFGAIGIFILFLACINFINLTTANSQRRAKEIGIRKTIGSRRYQLFYQFMIESLLVVLFSFLTALLMVSVFLPFFNLLADKQLVVLWDDPGFWGVCISCAVLTGLLAGLYPALYLSSFQPVKVLKGVFRFSKAAIFQRKSLIVFQFAISVVLVISTIIIFQQIQFSKNRPIGYNLKNLINFPISPEINSHFMSFRDELIKSGAAIELTKSANSTIDYNISDDRITWEGKDANISYSFPISNVTSGYGKTIGWQILKGRDFSGTVISDSSAFILNEASVKFMGFKDPIGKTVKWNDKAFHIIGIIKDIVFESPYKPVQPYIYQMTGDQSYVVTAILNNRKGVVGSLDIFKTTFEKYSPAEIFDYKFVDQEYSRKFGEEERISRLASFFSALAIFISCIGIFGFATLMADQRIKEIGIRKVMGSSVYGIWRLIAGDFVWLTIFSILIASPIAWYFVHNWLQDYPYRVEISGFVFIITGLGLIAITLGTVSYQIIKAALINPVKILRSE